MLIFNLQPTFFLFSPIAFLSLCLAAYSAHAEKISDQTKQTANHAMEKKLTEHSITKQPSVDQLVKSLDLEPHVEGGYYRRTYQSDHRATINTPGGERFLLTSIYYLLTKESPIGHWHKNKSDIIHYYHIGKPITYYLIHENGELETVTMGSNPLTGEKLQLVVKGGTWKASYLTDGEYALISEAVAPGFDFKDMVLGEENNLLTLYPQHSTVIKQFSKH